MSGEPSKSPEVTELLPASRALVALGANLGDPLETLPRALERLDLLGGVHRVATSRAYRTKPFDAPTPQPDYWNAVCELETKRTSEELLSELHRVEQEFGRDRDFEGHHGARRLDLDLLAHGQRVVEGPGLRLPHPGLEERLFVLAPLCDLRPGLRLPSGTSVRERADQLRGAGQALLEVIELFAATPFPREPDSRQLPQAPQTIPTP